MRFQAEQGLGQLSSATAQPSPNIPRVFIHYNDPNDQSEVAEIANDIRTARIFVFEGVQLSQGFTTGDIRYYYIEDKSNVDTLIKRVNDKLKGRSLTMKPRFLGNYYKDVARGTIEVWIPSLNSLPELVPEELEIIRGAKSAARP